MQKPIACSLSDGEAQRQVAEWRTALTAVIATEREEPGTVRMRLASDADVGVILALAEREVACCPFFAFAIEVDAEGLAFRASVPADAAPMLDMFVALAP